MHTPTLRLQTPTVSDLTIMLAAASDPQAQHWLGWTGPAVLPEHMLERLLASPAGHGRFPARRYISGANIPLAAIDPAEGTVAGAIGVDLDTCEIGGWLAPRFRGRCLGADLFAGAAELAHQHLAIPSVTAGTETTNAACIAALTRAGFTPTPGPSMHTLPNGREVQARWFRHDSPQPTTCTP